jgi:Leukotriene A4 hydrolase, C-terminal
VGRIKLVLPVYGALVASGQEAFAREVFDRARPGYHPIITAGVARILQPGSQGEHYPADAAAVRASRCRVSGGIAGPVAFTRPVTKHRMSQRFTTTIASAVTDCQNETWDDCARRKQRCE